MINLKNISKINLHNCSIKELEEIAAKIRNLIITTVSKNGGHLAPSLGTVELTLAIHSTFHSPMDKIIWDVGHQAYAHKILTERNKTFETLRQYQGMSGFPKRSESEHDIFDTGHSSTSISAALGLAKARDLKEENYKIVAVIGDGALTGGMAFEALNQAGHLKTDLIVILNDNEMSISPNVGALSSYLSKLRTAPLYFKSKKEIEQLLKKLPTIGNSLYKVADRVKDSLKYALLPGILFEELGFTYLGPIDGHNITNMQKVLKRAKNLKGPVLIHAITKKGKGYQPAELNPNKFHGVGPFDLETGEALSVSKKTFTDVFAENIVTMAAKDEKIVAITAAMPTGTGLQRFAEKYPKRFFDVGIAEQHAITFAAGLAVGGLKPIVGLYSTFLQRGYDQVIHDVCMQDLSVVFAIDRSGLVGEDGETHHGIFDLTFLRPIPNLTIMAPKDELEFSQMLELAFDLKKPVVIRYPKAAIKAASDKESQLLPIEAGKAEIISHGKDLIIITYGPLVYECLEAAKLMEAKGYYATIINVRFLKPLDEKLLTRIIKKDTLVVTVEEHVLNAGFGSAIEELLNKNHIKTNLLKIGLPNEFITQGNLSYLKELYKLDATGIAQKIEEYLTKQHFS